MARVSNKRDEILAFVQDFSTQNGYAPTVREIMRAVGLKSTATVHYHLSKLKELGKIDMDEMKKRTISLPNSGHNHQIPVLGVVTAGYPILAQENVEG